jgi:nitroreductase
MAENEVLKIIRQRRSVRNYLDRSVSDGDIAAVLEAGLWAPSGEGNIEKDIHFTVIRRRETLDRINDLSKETARGSELSWIAEMGRDEHFHCLYSAPVLILVSYREKTACPETDSAAATENMLLAAESLGLGSCWLYFPLQAFHGAEGRELLHSFKLPEGFRPFSSLVLGYRSGPAETAAPRRTENIFYAD